MALSSGEGRQDVQLREQIKGRLGAQFVEFTQPRIPRPAIINTPCHADHGRQCRQDRPGATGPLTFTDFGPP